MTKLQCWVVSLQSASHLLHVELAMHVVASCLMQCSDISCRCILPCLLVHAVLACMCICFSEMVSPDVVSMQGDFISIVSYI